jgi:hypothetical protein
MKIANKKRKQVSVEFLEHIKNTVNDMLSTRIPQSTKQKLCILVEKMLMETKSYEGFKYLYWSRYGCLDWEEAKQKAVYKVVPYEYIIGPDANDSPDFTSDIQGEYSRRYT